MKDKMDYPWYNRVPLKSKTNPRDDRVFRNLADKFGTEHVKADMRSLTHAEFAETYGLKVKG